MAWNPAARTETIRKEIHHKEPIEEFYEKFEEALVIGYISSDVKYTKNGECEFTLRVPFKYAEHCFGLRHAIGVPCEIFLKKWDPSDG